MDVYVYEVLLNCTLKVGTFHCMCVMSPFKNKNFKKWPSLQFLTNQTLKIF